MTISWGSASDLTDAEDANEPYKEKYKNMQEEANQSKITSFFLTRLLFPLCHALHILHSPSQFSASNNSIIPIYTSTNIFMFINH
jgi:hypothetical protein